MSTYVNSDLEYVCIIIGNRWFLSLQGHICYFQHQLKRNSLTLLSSTLLLLWVQNSSQPDEQVPFNVPIIKLRSNSHTKPKIKLSAAGISDFMHMSTCVLTHHMGLLLLFLLPYINQEHFQGDKTQAQLLCDGGRSCV